MEEGLENDKLSREDVQPPSGQRHFDNPWLLLAAGMIVMFAFYTIWGLIEILSLPHGDLP